MRIVILTGHTSSATFIANDGCRDRDYMHGPEWRARVEDADVIVSVWPPDDEPVLLKAPPGVTVQSLDHSHKHGVRLLDSMSEDEWSERAWPRRAKEQARG
jgi:hypothetical protein